MSLDPAVSLTLTPYGYADDNPLNAVDPTGLSWYNPFSWSADTWGTVAAVTGFVAAGAILCAATACIGDIAALAGATTVEGTLAAAETVGTVADWVGTGAMVVGFAADTSNIIQKGPGQWRSAQCLTTLGGTALDAATFGGEHLFSDYTLCKYVYEMGEAGASLLYQAISEKYLESHPC